MTNLAIALRAYLEPMASTRALRIWILGMMGFLGLVGLAVVVRPLSDFLSAVSLSKLHDLALIPGVPLTAILLSEMPLRDGIRHRTLLYPLLGPVPRFQLAVVRTLATAVLLAVGVSISLFVVRLLEGGGFSGISGELVGIWLGSVTYMGMFGTIHLLNRRGLIASLAVYGLLDDPLGRLPFHLRNLSPSYHLRELTGQLIEIELPIPITPPETSSAMSMGILAVLGVVFTVFTAYLFSRKNLGDLC